MIKTMKMKKLIKVIILTQANFRNKLNQINKHINIVKNNKKSNRNLNNKLI